MAYFTAAIGWIELGYDVDSRRSSFTIALDPGGLVWEGGTDTNPSMRLFKIWRKVSEIGCARRG